jgi:hypothetical protein
MTIEHAPSTNGRVHTGDTQPSEPRAYQASDEHEESSGIRKLIMPVVLMILALFVLRRLNKGNVV